MHLMTITLAMKMTTTSLSKLRANPSIHRTLRDKALTGRIRRSMLTSSEACLAELGAGARYDGGEYAER